MNARRAFGVAMRQQRGTPMWQRPVSAAAHVLFEEIRMLEPRELDGEAVLEIANDAALHLAERHQRAHGRPLVGGDTGARLRYVDDAAADVEAVGHDEPADRIARGDTAVAAVFRQSENLPVGEPGELSGELVALARSRRNRHGEAVLKDPRDVPLKPAEGVHIGDNAFARLAADGSDHGHAARRHVDHLAGKLPAVCQHIAAKQVDFDTLEAPALCAQRSQTRKSFG